MKDEWLDSKMQVQARLFAGQQRYASNLIYGTPFSFPAAGDWRGVELRGLYLGVSGHKLMLGMERQDNVRVDQQILDLANPGHDRSISSPGSRTGAQDEWRIADALTATLGLRLD